MLQAQVAAFGAELEAALASVDASLVALEHRIAGVADAEAGARGSSKGRVQGRLQQGQPAGAQAAGVL